MMLSRKKNQGDQTVPRLIAATTRTDDFQVRRFVLHAAASITSTAAGVINTVVNNDPSGSSDWNLLANYYDEFRVIGVQVHFVSLQQFSVTKANALLCVVFDNDDAGALTSYGAAVTYSHRQNLSTVMTHPQGKPCVLSFARPATQSSPIAWIDCASPNTSPGSIKMYADSLAVSTIYFHTEYRWVVEARGRR